MDSAELAKLIKELGSYGLIERFRAKYKGSNINTNDVINNLRNTSFSYLRVQGIGDDFLPPTEVYDAVGAIYPALPRSFKDDAIVGFLNKFDSIRYDRVQNNHTSYIREPALVTDICVVRPLYWPGIDEGKHLIGKYSDFGAFKSEVMEPDGLFDPEIVHGDFFVAYALLRDKSTNSPYAKAAHPEFLKRAVEGIVKWHFSSEDAQAPAGKAEELKKFKEILPEEAHGLVDEYVGQEVWAHCREMRLSHR